MLNAYACTETTTRQIEGLFLATENHAALQALDARVLLDIDLSILGQPAPIYDD